MPLNFDERNNDLPAIRPAPRLRQQVEERNDTNGRPTRNNWRRYDPEIDLVRVNEILRAIREDFNWELTPQGLGYWENVCSEIVNVISVAEEGLAGLNEEEEEDPNLEEADEVLDINAVGNHGVQIQNFPEQADVPARPAGGQINQDVIDRVIAVRHAMDIQERNYVFHNAPDFLQLNNPQGRGPHNFPPRVRIP